MKSNRHVLPLSPVDGIRLGTVAAGIKAPSRRDLVVIELCEGADCAAVFTRNAFCAAPVVVARRHLASAPARYLVINTGYANAGTGAQGERDAERCCERLADLGNCGTEQVLPFSTGIIGEPLPVDRICAGLADAVSELTPDGWNDAAAGMMTTDTVAKGVCRQATLDGIPVTVTGIAKGAGMIRPDMATMLVFIATDARVAPTLLNGCLNDAVEDSFHCITVDGDTSTNDACVLIATGRSAAPAIESADDPRYPAFAEAVAAVSMELARALVRDAEGATKLIAIEVDGGADRQECRLVAFTIAHSPLVKTAFFAGDPNWGRILAAVGRAGIADLDIGAVSIHLDEVCVARGGARAADYSEARGQAVMSRNEVTIKIQLGRGDEKARIWTSDLSYDYVRINAEYRT